MQWDFRHHLLLQIEMLRGDISHEELSQRLGEIAERELARYFAGKSHLVEHEFRRVAKALGIEADVLAKAWASSLGLRVSKANPVHEMVDLAFHQWLRLSRSEGVPSRPSPMAVIRARFADRLSREAPPLWFGAHAQHRDRRPTPESRARFARAYSMLVDFVHGGLTAREVGALHGVSDGRARYLMTFAALAWAAHEKIDLRGAAVAFKNEAKSVKNLYAGMSFFAQQRFRELAAEAGAKQD